RVAMTDGTIVVGALFESGSAQEVNGDDDNPGPASGAAYVFERDNSGNWQQLAYLKAVNSTTNQKFGASVAISEAGDAIAVDATGDSTEPSSGLGSVHM